MIVLDQIGHSYGEKWALKNVSFKIQHESIHGLLGPNGAGKTTTLKILAGLIIPTEGSLSLYGLDPLEKFEQTKKMIGLLSDVPPLYPELKVRDYLYWVAELHGLSRRQAQDATELVAEETGLTSVIHRLIGNLSKGYKQKVGIAQALVHSPKILILDEPTSGLDPHAVVEMREFIRSLKKSRTIILSSHHLHEVELLCDQVTLIHQGGVKAHGRVDDVKRLLMTDKIFELEWIPRAGENFQGLMKLPMVKDFILKQPGLAQIILQEKNESYLPLLEWLIEHKIELQSFKPIKLDLEEAFLALTKEEKS